MSEEETNVGENVPKWGYLTFTAADRQPTYEEMEQSISIIPDHRGNIQMIFALVPEPDEDLQTMSMSTTLDQETTNWVVGVIQRALFSFVNSGDELSREQVPLEDQEKMKTVFDEVKKLVSGDFEELSDE